LVFRFFFKEPSPSLRHICRMRNGHMKPFIEHVAMFHFLILENLAARLEAER